MICWFSTGDPCWTFNFWRDWRHDEARYLLCSNWAMWMRVCQVLLPGWCDKGILGTFKSHLITKQDLCSEGFYVIDASCTPRPSEMVCRVGIQHWCSQCQSAKQSSSFGYSTANWSHQCLCWKPGWASYRGRLAGHFRAIRRDFSHTFNPQASHWSRTETRLCFCKVQHWKGGCGSCWERGNYIQNWYPELKEMLTITIFSF